MIYKETPSSVRKVGEIKSNKVGIQNKDISFILSILSSNLYSNPIGSLIREYVSNAVDSHKEAGVEEPVIVSLYLDSEKNFWFSVKDFGVGISPERFNDVFINLASSTKRESNEYIGMWGLGRLSGLSYSDSVTITSNYNGTSTSYLMYKDGTDINIDELYSEDTEEGNGVEIKILLKNGYKDAYKFITELPSQLLFFDSVYYDIDEGVLQVLDENRYYAYSRGEVRHICNRLRNLRIKRYNTFCVSSLQKTSREIEIVLGNVIYKVDSSKIKCEFPPLGIYPMFQVGELEVTPNREEVQYSDKNIKVITDRVSEVLKEIKKVYKTELTRNFNYLWGYIREKVYGELDLMKSEGKYSNSIKIWDTDNLTYKGRKLNLDVQDLIFRFNNAYPPFKPNYILRKDYFNITKCKIKAEDFIKEIEGGNFLICDVKKLSKRALEYLKTNKFKDEESVYIFKKYPDPEMPKNFKLFEWVLKEDIKNIPTFTDADVPESFVYKEEEDEDNSAPNKNQIRFKVARLSKTDDSAVVFDPHCFSDESEMRKLFRDDTVFYYGFEENETLISDLYCFTKGVAGIRVNFLKVGKNFNPPEDFIHIVDFFSHKNKVLDRLYMEYRIVKELWFIDYVKSYDVQRYNDDLYNLLRDYSSGLKRGDNIGRDYYKYLRKQLEKYTNPDSELLKRFQDNYENLKNLYIFYVFRNPYVPSRTVNEESYNLLTDYVTTKNIFPVKQEMIDKLNKETVFNNHLTIKKI
jgi:hypothetical protein